MDERELAGLRTALEGFAAEVFEPLARSDQRAAGLRYLRGLMLDGKRKSMQPMAERLGIDYQQFQQFLTSSTWDYVAVRRRLVGRVIERLCLNAVKLRMSATSSPRPGSTRPVPTTATAATATLA